MQNCKILELTKEKRVSLMKAIKYEFDPIFMIVDSFIFDFTVEKTKQIREDTCYCHLFCLSPFALFSFRFFLQLRKLRVFHFFLTAACTHNSYLHTREKITILQSKHIGGSKKIYILRCCMFRII